jgi:ion channel-forming bestrophin family protein
MCIDTMDFGPDVPEEERRVRVLIEKKTVLNLVDAFCVAIKHYLRGETGMVSTLRIFMTSDDISS